MKQAKQLLGTVSAVSLIAFTSAPALAAGTDAGDLITNNVSVSYDVGGVTQTPETASDTFTVDRIVDVTVAEVGGAATSVSPGETQAATTFTVTNNSNDTVDFALDSAQSVADDFNVSNVQFYVDDGNGTFGPEDTLVTFLDEVPEDATVTVHVVGDVPITAMNGDTAEIFLIADAHEAGGAGVLGTEHTDTAGANTAGIDTVLADLGTPNDDGANEGDHSDMDSYVVAAADLSVAKTSTVISDPVNGTTNPKAVPGAVVEYCITVSNAAGAALATNVVINDDYTPEDASLDFLPDAYGAVEDIMIDGDGSCAGGTGVDKSYTTGTTVVNNALSDVPAGTTRSLRFRVTIQ
jgi:uncharacterized repeat protein (TIGR01451 family)